MPIARVSENIRGLVEPVIQGYGVSLVDVEYVRGPQGMTLRLIIDREGGVTLDDCEAVSKVVGDILDSRDLLPGPYSLEVSSPGINRPLKTWKDFERFMGQKVFVETREAIGGRRRFKGILSAVSNNVLSVSIGKEIFEIPFVKVTRARLDIL